MNTDWEVDYWTGVNPAGYSRPPARIRCMMEGATYPEWWKEQAWKLLQSQPFQGAKVMEIGCGCGFLTEDLADFGIDIIGIDISTYAINVAKARRPDLAARFVVGDVRTALAAYKRNAFDYLVSRDFLVCLTDAELAAVLSEGARIARNQLHLTKNGTDNAEYYNLHNITDYVAMRPNPNVRFVDMTTGEVA